MTAETEPRADTLSRDALFIDGEWARPTAGGLVEVISPSTEEPIATAALAGPHDVERAVSAARAAFDSGPWPGLTADDRAGVLLRMADGIAARATDFDYLGGAEVGAIVAMAQGFRASAESLLRYHAEAIRRYPTSELVTGLFSAAEVRRVPVGVCAVVVPWNAPLSIAMFAVAPALATGCTVVLKSPVETPLAVYELGDIASEAGLPPGVLNIICADREVSETLVRHRSVDKLSFTGSTEVGRRIGAIAGERLVPATLELGGKSAAIVLDDADPAETALALAPLTMLNSGQACTNVTRVLIPRRRHDEFADALAAVVAAFTVGDPFDPATFVGPVISERQRARIERYLASSQAEGARVLVGGGRPTHLPRGYYIEPTLYDRVDNGMTIAREEIFGPVVAVIDHDGDDDAVALANDSDYGLSGNVWSPDPVRARAVAMRVRTGNIGVNGNFLDWAVPFGGMKQSGLGRQFGRFGLDSFHEVQAIHQAPQPG